MGRRQMKTVDLHGKTIHEAWKTCIGFAYEKSLDKEKHIRVITGHGAIQKEFPRWCESCTHARSWETEPYNAGSWKVRLR